MLEQSVPKKGHKQVPSQPRGTPHTEAQGLGDSPQHGTTGSPKYFLSSKSPRVHLFSSSKSSNLFTCSILPVMLD